jgi:DNA mismatch repair protein MutS
MALIKDFFDLTRKYEEEYGSNTVFLIQVGSFFECYGLKDANDIINGSNIVEFARICDLNIADKRVSINSEQVVMAGFTYQFLDKYVKKMQHAGYTVAVYAQDDIVTPGDITRSLLGVFSPGTYFSYDTENITNITCCIWIEIKADPIQLLKTRNTCGKQLNVYIGVSTIDIYTGKTSIMEYSEPYIKNPTTFDELEQFISIYNPSETIIISNILPKDLDDIVSYTNIRSKSIHYVSLLTDPAANKNTFRAFNCEKQTYQCQLLSRFYKFNDITAFLTIFNNNAWSTQSFCYLLDFIYQHNPNLVYRIAEPIIEDKSNRLILANHSLKQLNIIEDINSDYKGKYSSVSRMLNECITSMGKRKFTYQFLNPVTDKIFLQEEYDIIEDVLTNFDQNYQIIKSMLVPMKDLVKIGRQIILGKISPKTVYQLYSGIIGSKSIYHFILGNPVLHEYLKKRIPEFDYLLVHIDEISKRLDTIFIMDDCKDIENIQKIEKSFIRTGIDTSLDEKIRILTESQDQLECCRFYFSSVISQFENGSKKKNKGKSETNDSEPCSEYVKIHETEKNHYSLLATDRRCKVLEEVLKKGIGRIVTLKYRSRFYNKECEFILDLEKDPLEFNKQTTTNKIIVNNQINKLCKDVSLIKTNFIETVSVIYSQIIKSLDIYQPKIDIICELITFTDIVYSKAFIANKYNYCKPEIQDLDIDINIDNKSYVNVVGLRHCLIEKIQQSELYVANDIGLGLKSMDGLLLYGTNAVGKTSFIRALGISVIMAQAGLYVPASSYKFNPYKYIFTRIIGNDNLFKGLSTFAVEMSELRTILRLSDKNSLVLGDELCSGTESTSATSIFVAGIQSLEKKQCSFIFATHLHEIIGYDEIIGLKNVALKHMSVIYDKEKDCLIYDRKLKDGPGTNMYGLEVCKSLSLPQDFLEAALSIRMKYHPQSASILDQKKSHYNASVIKGLCENCNGCVAKDVHHLIHQQEADPKGLIHKKGRDITLHKNHAANLLNLCQKCHDDFHSEEKNDKIYKKVKTTKGTIIKEI